MSGNIGIGFLTLTTLVLHTAGQIGEDGICTSIKDDIFIIEKVAKLEYVTSVGRF